MEAAVYIDDQPDNWDEDKLLRQVSSQRREYALRYKSTEARKECLAAYRLLTEGLRTEFGIMEPPVFLSGNHGKPALADYPNVHFNLSHCREAVACAIASHPVGIDVETIEPLDLELMQKVMSKAEQVTITRATNPEVIFTCLWTQKESLLKLWGTGLIDELSTLLDNTSAYRFHTWMMPRCICTLCEHRPQ